MDDQRAPVSRRAMMTGLGVTAGAVVLSERAAGASVAVPRAPTFAVLPNAAPAIPAGNEFIGRYDIRLAACEFRPAVSSAVTSLASGALTVVAAATLTAACHPRSGDSLSSVTVFVDPAGTAGALRLARESSTGTSVNLGSVAIPATTGVTSVTLNLPALPAADPFDGNAYTVQVVVGAAATLYGAQVGVFNVPNEFVLVTPFRVWDSRTTSGSALFPGANGGRILSGQQRGFTVDGYITRYASGLLLNVTLDQTVASGYLTFFAPDPDTTTPPPVSSINWYAANQIVANLVVTGMAGEADVQIACGGGGSTHYIIDALGYFI
jgi:hypothetical protein